MSGDALARSGNLAAREERVRVAFKRGHLPEHISGIGIVRRRVAPQSVTSRERVETGTDRPFKEAKEEWVSSFERDYILNLLKKNSFNISHASREADIDRKYFRKLMKKYEIETPSGAPEVETTWPEE